MIKLTKDSEKVELALPSKFGYEKIAMAASAIIAEGIGFPSEKIEDLKTAISEACINAIEHGNKMQADKKVTILFGINESKLTIEVMDEGEGSVFHITEKSDLTSKLEGKESPRGLGLFLIKSLMDEAEFVPGREGSQLRMVIYLKQEKTVDDS
ncbi:MAG: ATP-binding protein [Nitrospirae bacterium]|nr:ATP-binding protein [Nitrospirota bacterium]